MKKLTIIINFIIFFINLSVSFTKENNVTSHNPPLTSLTQQNNNEGEEVGAMALDFLVGMINDTYQNVKDQLNQTCSEALEESINQPHRLYMIKLLRDSAKNKNDLGSYLDCFTINYQSFNNSWTNDIKQNLTYLVVHVSKKSNWYTTCDVRHELGNFIFGLCVIKGCSNDEYRLLFDSLNNQTGIFLNTTISDMRVLNWGENYMAYYSKDFFWEMIPLYILMFIALWSCFPSVPVSIFKRCFRKNEGKNEIADKFIPTGDYDSLEIRNRFLDQTSTNKGRDDSNSSYSLDSDVESVEEKIKISYDEMKLNRLKNCFVLNENAEEILNTNFLMHNVNTNDDSGLSFVKGLRGMTMIFTLLGCVFKILYNSPIKIFCNIAFRDLVMGFFFSFILFGLRFGPRIFFSISGYCLMYKLLCYLDNEVDKLENSNKKDIADSSSNSHSNSNSNSNSNPNEKVYENDKTYTFVDGGGFNDYSDHKDYKSHVNNYNNITGEVKKSEIKPSEVLNFSYTRERNDSSSQSKSKVLSNSNNFSNSKLISYQSHSNFSYNLPFSSLVYFISLQSYKYFLYVMAILFFKFSYYNFIGAIYSPGPIWLFLKETIINTFQNNQVISMIFLFSTFSQKFYYIYDMFWMAANEIVYFVIFSFLIFIFYKKNWRFDAFIIYSYIFIIFGKLFLFLFMFYCCEEKFLPALSFQPNNYNFISKNPFFNMPCFLVGLFFGSVNYCIQKSITSENIQDVNKHFLRLPSKFRSFFKRYEMRKVIATSVIFGLLFLLIILGYMLIYDNLFKEDQFMTEFYHNLGVNIFFLVDIDLGILFLFIIITPLFLMGDNFIISFFKHEYWNFLARPYFMFILVLNMVTLYVFYQSESRVKLELFNIIFFSLLVLMIMMIMNALFYIIFEVPLKKLNKFLLEEIRESKERGRRETVSTSNHIIKQNK